MKINLTPHQICVHLKEYRDDSNNVQKPVVCLPRSGSVARLTSVEQVRLKGLSEKYGVPVFTAPSFDGVEGLPADTSKTIVVSRMVAQYLCSTGIHTKWQGTILVPDSGPQSVRRNDEGEITGISRLYCYQTYLGPND